MLLLNRTLIRMAKGLWGWIFVIAGLKLAVLAGTAAFARIISGVWGNIASPEHMCIRDRLKICVICADAGKGEKTEHQSKAQKGER